MTVATTSGEDARNESRTHGWMPGLDGLRAIAVIGVVLFHARVPGARGGFLGVSLFLTLSGFLITERSLAALNRGERVSALRFTARRLRRLAPAALAVVALGLVVIALIGTLDQRAHVRTDALWAMTYLQNWRSALSGDSYAAAFAQPSPFEHYWSLAVEEQFYLAFPILLFGLVRLGRRRVAALVGVVAAASIGLALFAGFDPGRRYYGTDTRAWELLAGVLLALAGSAVAPWVAARPRVATAARRAALGLFVAGVIAIEVDGPWVTRGWFVLGPLVAVPLISTVAVAPGRLLTAAPLRRVGELAYGIYLLHWPLQLVMDHLYPSAPSALGGATVLAVSFVLASVLLRLVENPVRFRPEPRVWAPRIAGVVTAVALAWFAVPVPSQGELVVLPDIAADTRIEIPVIAPDPVPSTATPTTATPATATPTPPPTAPTTAPTTEPVTPTTGAPPPTPPPTTAAPTTAPPTTRPAPLPVRTVVVGDSTAFTLILPGEDLAGRPVSAPPPTRSFRGGSLPIVGTDVRLGCGIARHDGLSPDCAARWSQWAELIDTARPDLVMFLPGQWELIDLRIGGVGTSVEDDRAADFVRREYVEAMRMLGARGARIAVVTNGPFVPSLCAVRRLMGGTECDADELNRRIERLNGILRAAAAEVGAAASVVELGDWLRTADADGRLRPDGAHWSADGTGPTWAWLGPELLRLMGAPAAP